MIKVHILMTKVHIFASCALRASQMTKVHIFASCALRASQMTKIHFFISCALRASQMNKVHFFVSCALRASQMNKVHDCVYQVKSIASGRSLRSLFLGRAPQRFARFRAWPSYICVDSVESAQ